MQIPIASLDDPRLDSYCALKQTNETRWANEFVVEGDKLTRRLAVLLGSEGHGLTADQIASCDRRVTIPMQSHTDSLNVAMTAGIVLCQFRQLKN